MGQTPYVFCGGGTIIRYGWYLQTILFLYVLFWVCFSVKAKDAYKIRIFAVGFILFYISAYAFHITPTWYATAPCMLLGMLWQINNDKIDAFLSNSFRKWGCVFLSLCGCAIIKAVSGFLPEDILYLTQITGTAIFFTIAIIVSIKGISLVNPLTSYLGKISLEIYVFQGAVIMIAEKIGSTNVVLFGALIIAGTLLLAGITNPVLKKFNVVLNKLCKI